MFAIILIIFLLSVGFFIYKDYGISWDEFHQRSIGIINLKYIYEYLYFDKFLLYFFDNVTFNLEKIKSFNEWKDQHSVERFYGAVFETPVAALEYFFFGYSHDDQKIYHFRHLINFFVFNSISDLVSKL